MQTVTARHPDAARLRSGAAAGVGSRVGVVNTSYQVGLALHFAAAVAGVAARTSHSARSAARRLPKASDLQDNTEREDVSVDPG